MNDTPRLRSAFPLTPRTERRTRVVQDDLRRSFGSPNGPLFRPVQIPSPQIKKPIDRDGPTGKEKTFIPLTLIDAPTQRAYVGAIYLALLAWKLQNYWQIVDDLDATWMFLKWIVIDMLFLFGLPALHIPWLEYSLFTTVTLYVAHFIADAFLMFRIPIPLITWAYALLKLVYNQETALSEHKVNPAKFLPSSSIILGKQIVQILPEGSAVLNPEMQPLCIGDYTKSVEIPIQINQTNPKSIEFLRYDLQTYESEIITVSGKHAQQLKRTADKQHPKSDKSKHRLLKYKVKDMGLYRLNRVVDESNLDVRIKNFDTLIAPCPNALLYSASNDRCKDDLSDVALQVSGVAPFKVTYSKQINNLQSASSIQSVQPPGLESPLNKEGKSGALVNVQKPNLDWAKSRTVTVPINESLSTDGVWTYRIDKVEDGSGNLVKYSSTSEGSGSSKHSPPMKQLEVHNRPKISLKGCKSQRPLQVPQGDDLSMPLQIHPNGFLSPDVWPLELNYTFTPDLEEGTTEASSVKVEQVGDRDNIDAGSIRRPGKYDLISVASRFCAGEISEPSSCRLTNPPRPAMVLTKEDLSHKCAGKSVGFRVDLDFTGTPPFFLRYESSRDGNPSQETARFEQLRGQLEFKPPFAGSYKYKFIDLRDNFYGPISLTGSNMLLKQNIQPPASAVFENTQGQIYACLGQQIAIRVNFYGEGPWTLDYELVAGSKRQKQSIESTESTYDIILPPFSSGGQHTLVLTNVKDKSKCSQSIKEELKLEVRHDQPSAAFGKLNDQREILALEGKAVRIPLRLQGDGPWDLEFVNKDKDSSSTTTSIRSVDGSVSVYQDGKYELLSVHDKKCPGKIVSDASTFQVIWINRPVLSISDQASTRIHDKSYQKSDVCEGDDDTLNLAFTGNPPYSLKYEQKTRPLKGAASVGNKPLVAAAIGSASVSMDTSKAGDYTYIFKELSDARYSYSKQHFTPINVMQKVHPLPDAKFSKPGKTHSYCKDSAPDSASDTESITIMLEGTPPFSLEIGVTHHGSARPEVIRIKDIATNKYSWTIPRRSLTLGTHSVSIRSVKDSRGCVRTIDSDSSSIRIRVSDPPNIIPLEAQTDYCVGEHVSFSLTGQPNFKITYKFQDKARSATVKSTTFRRITDRPGEFVVLGISDDASGKCKAEKDIRKVIRPMPTARIGRGTESRVEIPEGGEASIEFTFTGTPPFEFTYTRSETQDPRKRKTAPVIHEIRHETSAGFIKTIKASYEGTYEVIAIKDAYCAFPKPVEDTKSRKAIE